MFSEPSSNCRDLAIWQQRHNPSSLEIADNRSVAAIASKSPTNPLGTSDEIRMPARIVLIPIGEPQARQRTSSDLSQTRTLTPHARSQSSTWDADRRADPTPIHSVVWRETRLVDRVRDWAPSSFHRHVESSATIQRIGGLPSFLVGRLSRSIALRLSNHWSC
jgi:hypothetical protein